MRSIKFAEDNIVLAKDQEEYESMYVSVDMDSTAKPMTACFELSKEEIEEINKTGRLYYTQCTFGNLFHPMMITTNNIFTSTPIK